jgi:hypothetical protein
MIMVTSSIENDVQAIEYKCKCKVSLINKDDFPELIPTWPWVPILTMKCVQCEDVVSVEFKYGE